MKNQIKKLRLNKTTISNLNAYDLSRQVGGGPTNGNGNTCVTCVTCTCAYMWAPCNISNTCVHPCESKRCVYPD